MKKLLAILVLVLIGTMSYAQWTNGTGNNIYKTTMPGYVGIGLTAPLYHLHVFEPAAAATCFVESGRTTDNKAVANFQLKATGTGDMFLMSLRKFAGVDELLQSAYIASTNTWLEFVYLNYTTKKYEMRSGIVDAEFQNSGKLLFNNGGNVGIGTTNPLAKLSVNGTGTFNGKVKCTEVEVLLAAWPDKVFKTGYNLMPLHEVETFVNENNHLPGVPSESEVLQNGINVGDMNAVLLQKIEELTLYMIDLKKQNDLLKDRIQKLER